MDHETATRGAVVPPAPAPHAGAVITTSLKRRLSQSAQGCVHAFVHFVGYHLLLRRGGTRRIAFAGFDLTIPPTVYDPRFYRAPAYFAEFIGRLDLNGKRVADVCTGSGLQALAAARAGAASVTAIDINPAAVAAATLNARANRFDDRISVAASNLLSTVPPGPQFDVILSNPPFCDGRAWDIADRAWRAGPQYEDIAPLFGQARERLLRDGLMYVVLSSHGDLPFIESIMARAGFAVRVADQRRVLFETLVIYELLPV